ncbi:MAG: TVP38/TMEM64 family protein [Nitrospirae bacterium]|nr:TVP38/TMEM64 family protein [Nitrospirota bacterium]
MAGNRVILKFTLFLAVIAISTAAIHHFGIHRLATDSRQLIGFIRSFGAASVPVFISIQVLQVLFAPIPGEVTGFVGGYIYGGPSGLVYSTIGLTIGSIIAFSLSRRFGRPFVAKFARQETLDKYDFLMEHKGIGISFLLFLVPGFPKDILCYILGTSKMPFRSFLIVSSVGRLFGTIGLSFGGSFIEAGDYRLFLVMVSIASVAALLSYIYRERLFAWLRAHKPHLPHKH